MKCLVLGQAKSGTTALHYTVAQALSEPKLHFEERIDELGALPDEAVVKIIFEHESVEAIRDFAQRFDHRLLLVRDPRDNLISRLLYLIAGRKALLQDERFLSDFLALLKQKQQEPGSIDTTRLFAMVEAVPGSFLSEALDSGSRFATFLEGCLGRGADDWFVVRYETMVGGDLVGPSEALGLRLQPGVTVDPVYGRVSRTNGAGDWRHWFTERDRTHLEPRLAPLMRRLGYDDGWEPAREPVIEPGHSWLYVSRLVAERRRHYGLAALSFDNPVEKPAPRKDDPLPPAAACPICNGTRFGPGPGGRTAPNGQAPACRQCGSLERGRVLWSIVRTMPPARLAESHALAFGNVSSLKPSWFRTWSRGGDCIPGSVGGTERRADLIIVDHILEYLEQDHAAFDELVRMLAPDGALLIVFSTPESRSLSQHFAAQGTNRPVRHLYGQDVIEYFECDKKKLFTIAVNLSDDCTQQSVVIYAFFKAQSQALEFWKRLFDQHPTASRPRLSQNLLHS